MNMITNHMSTAELQKLDAAHHMHPFTDANGLAAKGARVIKSAKGVWLQDSEGNKIIDGMAGLWCVNIGYGRTELGDVAKRQMDELSYYNTFFQTTHVPAIALSAEIAKNDKIDVIVSDFGPSLVGALPVFKEYGRSIPALATSDGNSLACFWEENKDANPDFKLFTVATGNDNVRLAVQWAVALATGGTPPADQG